MRVIDYVSVVGTQGVTGAQWTNKDNLTGAFTSGTADVTLNAVQSSILPCTFPAMPAGSVGTFRGIRFFGKSNASALAVGRVNLILDDSGSDLPGAIEDYALVTAGAFTYGFFDDVIDRGGYNLWDDGTGNSLGSLPFKRADIRAVRISNSVASLRDLARVVYLDKAPPSAAHTTTTKVTASAQIADGDIAWGTASTPNSVTGFTTGGSSIYADYFPSVPATKAAAGLPADTNTLRLTMGVDTSADPMTAPFSGSSVGSPPKYILIEQQVQAYIPTANNLRGPAAVLVKSAILNGPTGFTSIHANDGEMLSTDGDGVPVDLTQENAGYTPAGTATYTVRMLFDGTSGLAIPTRAMLLSGKMTLDLKFTLNCTPDFAGSNNSDDFRFRLVGAPTVTEGYDNPGTLNTPAAAYTGLPVPETMVDGGDGPATLKPSIFTLPFTQPTINADCRSRYDSSGVLTSDGQAYPRLPDPYLWAVGIRDKIKLTFDAIGANWPVGKPKRPSLLVYGPDVYDFAPGGPGIVGHTITSGEAAAAAGNGQYDWTVPTGWTNTNTLIQVNRSGSPIITYAVTQLNSTTVRVTGTGAGGIAAGDIVYPKGPQSQLNLITNSADLIGNGLSPLSKDNLWCDNGISSCEPWFAVVSAVLGELMVFDPNMTGISIVKVISDIEFSADAAFQPSGSNIGYGFMQAATGAYAGKPVGSEVARWASSSFKPIIDFDGTKHTVAAWFTSHSTLQDNSTAYEDYPGGFATDPVRFDIQRRGFAIYTICLGVAQALAIFRHFKADLPTFDSGQQVKVGIWTYPIPCSKANPIVFYPLQNDYNLDGRAYLQDLAITANYGIPHVIADAAHDGSPWQWPTLNNWAHTFPPSPVVEGTPAWAKPAAVARALQQTQLPQVKAGMGGLAANVMPSLQLSNSGDGTAGLQFALANGGTRLAYWRDVAGPTFADVKNVASFVWFRVGTSQADLDDLLNALVRGSNLISGLVGDPTFTGTTTALNTQTTAGLVATPNVFDGLEVTKYKVVGILNGTLFKHNGTTVVNVGDYLTLAELQDVGGWGAKFTPTTNYSGPASVTIRASWADGTTLSAPVTATITVGSAAVAGGGSIFRLLRGRRAVRALWS